MHELAIATNLAANLRRIMAAEQADRLIAVTLEIGELAGIEKDALAFAFPLAVEGTPLAGAELRFEDAPVMGYCRDCRTESKLQIPLVKCPNCDSLNVDIIRGREFVIKSIEVEEKELNHV